MEFERAGKVWEGPRLKSGRAADLRTGRLGEVLGSIGFFRDEDSFLDGEGCPRCQPIQPDPFSPSFRPAKSSLFSCCGKKRKTIPRPKDDVPNRIGLIPFSFLGGSTGRFPGTAAEMGKIRCTRCSSFRFAFFEVFVHFPLELRIGRSVVGGCGAQWRVLLG